VVVVVDQLEELFTQGSAEVDRLAMLRALIGATESCHPGHRRLRRYRAALERSPVTGQTDREDL
jgi:hypothetical protein